MKKLLFNWGISDHFGWGVYGLNLLEWGIINSRFQIIPLDWPPKLISPINELRINQIRQLEKSIDPNWTLGKGDIALVAVGNIAEKLNLPVSIKQAGVIFFESNPLPPNQIDALKKFDLVISGSSWNKQKLEQMGIKNSLVIQGVDTDLFRIQKKRIFRDRFVVYSGGKLEFRKGQDIALAAFSKFAEKYPDALLINTWRSPWEGEIISTINQSGLCNPYIPSEDVNESLKTWIRRNGVSEDQFLCLGPTPNFMMPEIFREVDLAVFPNRCEGGTNLVAMEALSSGISCAISKNTGHLDLIKGNNCIVLNSQSRVISQNTINTTDWGESSVDELIAVMEMAYEDHIKLNKETIRESMLNSTWEVSINKLLDCVSQI
ncbi:glycosyltransferase family 4 protein [Polynucleobacter paneuropaeus]|nr:glycosyltransferase family 4 protein [Polynucleobacter paneuropaeus]QWD09312.1 glycosyltransferase family 4 protein [Polynucleobacter paneuropaeus]QWD46079.1 glycosyltransferase family 4 protein [Polynucleobacter paneuropaeus]